MPETTNMDIRNSNIVTYLERPNNRFATAFIDTKYRSIAVCGECMQDKATGEIYLRRKTDGRIISFNQNDVHISNMMFEKRMLEASNQNIKRPIDPLKDSDTIIVAQNIDMSTINSEEMFDILDKENSEGFTILNNDNLYTNMVYKLSPKSTGFYVSLQTRYVDKLSIEYLTNLYDKNHNITNTNFFYKKNCIMNYSIYIYINGTEYGPYDRDIALRLNDMSCVEMPLINSVIDGWGADSDKDSFIIMKDIYKQISGSDPDNSFDPNNLFNQISSIGIKINKFTFDHLVEAFNYDNIDSQYFYGDKSIFFTNIKMISYLNNIDDLVLHNNETILAAVDLSTAEHYSDMMTATATYPQTLLTTTRPDFDKEWRENSVWSERLIDVDMQYGNYTSTISESRFNNLSRALAGYIIKDQTDTTLNDSIKKIEGE